MNIKETLQQTLAELIQSVYQIYDLTLEIQENKTDFEGDFTIVTFPLVKYLKKSPDQIGMELGGAFTAQSDFIQDFNVVKGFLNLTIKDTFFL